MPDRDDDVTDDLDRDEVEGSGEDLDEFDDSDEEDEEEEDLDEDETGSGSDSDIRGDAGRSEEDRSNSKDVGQPREGDSYVSIDRPSER